MYYSDLSPSYYNVTYNDKPARVLNVGWLEKGQPYSQGETTEKFRRKLLDFCLKVDYTTFGIHECDFCEDESERVAKATINQGYDRLRLGSSEILVCGQENILYLAPDLIYHYVVDHDYQPPDEFIQSVLSSPLPDTTEYQAAIKFVIVDTKITKRGRFESVTGLPWFHQNPINSSYYLYSGKLIDDSGNSIYLEIWRKLVEDAGGLEMLIRNQVVVVGEFIYYDAHLILHVLSMSLLTTDD